MIRRHARNCALTFALLALGGAPARAQVGSGVARAALTYLHDTLRAHPVLSVDPRIGVFAPVGRVPGTELHPAGLLAEAHVDGIAEVLGVDRARQCENVRTPGCQRNGIAAFVSLSVPQVRGDSAVVDAFLRFWRQPDAADSARMASARPQTAARMSAVVGTHFRLHLVRVSGQWRVVGHRIMGQS